jgi:hypothetical protein
MSTMTTSHATPTTERTYPPIGWLSTFALGCVIIGGIMMASYAPRPAPLGLPVTLLCAGGALLLTSWVMLARLKDFSWSSFWSVFKWALLAYAFTSGMIELAFVRDHTRGSPLVVITLMLCVFALSVPTTIAFTTARYANR